MKKLILNKKNDTYEILGKPKRMNWSNNQLFMVSYKNLNEMRREMKNLRKFGISKIYPYKLYYFLDFIIPKEINFKIKED